MNLLGIETTTSACEVSIVHKGTFSYHTIQESLAHSERLIGMIDDLLKKHGLSTHNLDGIAVDIGPGSFTGLRVGVSVARSLAQGLGIKIAPIAALDAIAYKSLSLIPDAQKTILCPTIDALRSEVYTALYEIRDGVLKRTTEYGIADKKRIIDFSLNAKNHNKKFALLGSRRKEHSDFIKENETDIETFFSSDECYFGDTIARMGVNVFEKKEELDYNAVVPLYIRKSHAEVMFELRQKSSNT